MNISPEAKFNRKAVIAFALGGASVLCVCFTGIPAIVFALLAFRELKKNRLQKGAGLAFTGMVAGTAMTLVALILALPLLPRLVEFSSAVGEKGRHNRNLSRIAKAMIAHDADKGALPARALCDQTGQPLLSWRVAILPYLGEQALFSEFKLNEPWNSPHNERLLARMPDVYKRPTRGAEANQTCYVVFFGKGSAFEGCEGIPLKTFTDGAEKTILVAESNDSVHWTCPEDVDYATRRRQQESARNFQGIFPNELNVGLANGKLHRVRIVEVSDQTLDAAVSRNAGDVVGTDW